MYFHNVINKKPSFFTSFINHKLMGDLIELPSNKELKLKFSNTYQLEYIGEVAERWVQRKGFITTNADLNGLIMGLAATATNSKNFLYNQKEIFIEHVSTVLEEQFEFSTALILFYFAYKQNVKIKESAALQTIYLKLMNHKESIKTGNELVFAIHVACSLYQAMMKSERGLIEIVNPNEWRKMICFLLEQLQLELNMPHEDYFPLALLAPVYQQLDKPKAKEFKTKGMVRYLQSISALMYKEVNADRSLGVSDSLNIKREDVYIYNYLLALEYASGHDQEITEPGYERICERYCETYFLVKKELFPLTFIKRLDEDKQRANSQKHFKLATFLHQINEFKNRNNLSTFLTYVKDDLLDTVSPSYITLIQDELIDMDKKQRIITYLLKGERCTRAKLTKEQFLYLLEQIESLQMNIEPNQYYSDLCFLHGHLSLEQPERLQELGFASFAIHHIVKFHSYADLIPFLERIDISYHDVLLNKKSIFEEKLEADLLKRFYTLYIEYLHYKNPEKYTTVIYELMNESAFIELFDFTAKEIEEVERTIFKLQMLPDQYMKVLYEKFTPAEVLQQRRIEKTVRKIEKYSLWEMKHYFKSHLNEIQTEEKVRQAMINQLQLLGEDMVNIDNFLLVFYQMKGLELLTREENQLLEQIAIQTIKEAI